MPTIKCKWCSNQYQAHNNNRGHCSRIECRTKEIEKNLISLRNYFGILLRHKIVSQVELRCPGNDSFGQQVKVTSECYINNSLERMNDTNINRVEIDSELNNLISYFRPILLKQIKGNFFVDTHNDGTIGTIIQSESFGLIDKPVILGNNLLVTKTG